jgi:hypothetical protein
VIGHRTSHRCQRDTPPRHPLFEMAKRDVQLGVAALCIGGGQGIAMVLEHS